MSAREEDLIHVEAILGCVFQGTSEWLSCEGTL